MKMVFAAMTLLMSVQTLAAPAANIEGVYQVVEGCKPNNMRLGVLELMYFEGAEVVIEVNKAKELLLFSAEHNTLALPLSSDTSLQPIAFEDYYSDADIRVTNNSYAMKTKGSEMRICEQHPTGLKYPCVRKWNDAIGMAVDAKGQLQIEWKVENTTGSCLLQRKN